MSESSLLHHGPCPSCGSHDANGFYDDGHTYCFSCQTHVNNAEEATPPTTLKQVHPRMSEDLISNAKVSNIPERMLRRETCLKFLYGVVNGNHVAPYYDNTGAIVGQKIRQPDKHFYWLGSPKTATMFGQQLWPSKGRRLVITEGEIDAMSVAQAFGLTWPVVSLKNGASGAVQDISSQIEWVEGYDTIVLAFDGDAPGRDAAHRVAALLTPGKVRIVNWPAGIKDANDLLKANRSDEIKTCVYDAPEFRPDGIVLGSDLNLEELRNHFVPSFDIPYKRLNELLHGVRKGEITLLTAGSGLGKSTAATEIGYDLMMRHGLKIGHVALEESVRLTSLAYMGIHLNVPKGELLVNPDYVDRGEYERAFREVVQCGRFFMYDHFGSLEGANLLAKLKYMIQGLGVDFIILDHISIVVSGMPSSKEGERKDIDTLMTGLRSMVQNTGVGMLAIVHLRRPGGSASYNEGSQISLNDLRGSGSLEQLSDNVIGIERDQQGDDPTLATFRLLKNRLFSRTGVAGMARYDLERGRLEDYSCDDSQGPF